MMKLLWIPIAAIASYFLAEWIDTPPRPFPGISTTGEAITCSADGVSWRARVGGFCLMADKP